MMITNLPAPVWMASADNCSGLWSCILALLFWQTKCAQFLDLALDIGHFPRALDVFSYLRSTVPCFLGYYRRPIDDTFTLSFPPSFLYRLCLVALNCFCCSQQSPSTSYGFFCATCEGAVPFVFAVFSSILLQSTPRVYFSFPSRVNRSSLLHTPFRCRSHPLVKDFVCV